jgi:hypothetical protein
VDFEEMAAEQNRCAATQRLLGGTSLKLAFRQTGPALNAWLVTFLLASSDQLFLKYSGKIFSHIFTMLLIPGGLPPVVLFHPGLCGTDYPATSLPGSVSIWPASGKIHCHTRLTPQPIPILQRRFSDLHVDLVGPLQYSNSFNYIFTIIDRTSKWMEALHQAACLSISRYLALSSERSEPPTAAAEA